MYPVQRNHRGRSPDRQESPSSPKRQTSTQQPIPEQQTSWFFGKGSLWGAMENCCGPAGSSMVLAEDGDIAPGKTAVLVNRRGDFGQLRTQPPSNGYNLRGPNGLSPAATTPQQAARQEGYSETDEQPNFFGTEEEPRLAGVGIIFRKGANGDGLVVDGLMPGCPVNTRSLFYAHQHVKPGMKLTKVAGRDVTYASQIDIAPLILGPLGTFVDIELEAQGRRGSVETTWKYRRGSQSLKILQIERFHEIHFNRQAGSPVVGSPDASTASY